LPAAQFGKLLTAKLDAAGGLLIQPQQRTANGGFPAAGFAHQAKNRSPANLKAHAIHRPQYAGLLTEQPIAQREVFFSPSTSITYS
jgi:hypothetical protein